MKDLKSTDVHEVLKFSDSQSKLFSRSRSPESRTFSRSRFP